MHQNKTLSQKLTVLTKKAVRLTITSSDLRLNGNHLTVFGIQSTNPSAVIRNLHQKFNEEHFGLANSYKITVTQLGPKSIFVDVCHSVTNGVLHDSVQQMRAFVQGEQYAKLLTYRNTNDTNYPSHIEVGNTATFNVGDVFDVCFNISV